MAILITHTLRQLLEPGCQKAVDEAIHEVDPVRFHQRVSGACPLCLTLSERIAKVFRTNLQGTAAEAESREAIKRIMELQDRRFATDDEPEVVDVPS